MTHRRRRCPTPCPTPRARSRPARTACVIGGERPEAADGRTFETLDPATGRAIADVPHAGAEDVDRAVRAAREAFEDGRWAGIAAAERTRAMLALRRRGRGARRRARRARVARQRQAGRSSRSRVDVRARRPRTCATSPAGRRKIEGETLPVAQPNMHCYTRKEPVGVCGQIIPWNFPLLMAAWKVAPGAGGRLHDRAEARRADAAHRAAARRAGARGRAPRGRAQRDHRRRRDRRGAGRPPRRRQDRLHRLDRGRAARSARRRAARSSA